MQKLADDARFNRFHAKVLLWCLLILIIDGYDIAVVGIALPSIMQQMGVNASTAGFMASSALFGMMFGAMVLGTLSDRIGRRWALSIGVMLFSVFTAAAGFTKDPISFSVVRFIAGLGIGGVLPVIVAQMVEYSPKKIRSLMTALMTSGYALGGILAAVLGKQLIGEYGWQVVFIAAGVPVLLIPFILKLVPESMTYLISRSRNGELAEVARNLQPGVKHPADAQFVVPTADRVAGAPVSRLFQDGRGPSTVLFWIAFFSGLFMVYALCGRGQSCSSSCEGGRKVTTISQLSRRRLEYVELPDHFRDQRCNATRAEMRNLYTQCIGTVTIDSREYSDPDR